MDKTIAASFLDPASTNYFVHQHKLADVVDGKIAVFGLPKAGNTWLHAMLCDITDTPPLFQLRDEGRGVLSTHEPCNEDIIARHDFVHCVCIIRDLRDIISSYFFYMQTDDYQKSVPMAAYPDIDTYYYDWFLSRLVPGLRVHTYWEEFAERGVPILRYERLCDAPEAELVRLFRRWGEPVDQDKVAAAVERNSFENLKSKGRQLQDVFIPTSHFRKGRSGSYKDDLPQHIIDDINSRFGQLLSRWGY